MLDKNDAWSLISKIIRSRNERAGYMVYSDWLKDHGHDRHAELVVRVARMEWRTAPLMNITSASLSRMKLVLVDPLTTLAFAEVTRLQRYFFKQGELFRCNWNLFGSVYSGKQRTFKSAVTKIMELLLRHKEVGYCVCRQLLNYTKPAPRSELVVIDEEYD